MLNEIHEHVVPRAHFNLERCSHKLTGIEKNLLASCLDGEVLEDSDLVLRVNGAVKGANGITFKGEKDEKQGDKPRSMFQLANGEAVGSIQYFCVLASGAGNDGIESLLAKVKLHKTSSRMLTQHSELPIFTIAWKRLSFYGMKLVPEWCFNNT